jgi:hypothetical protein
MRRRCNDCEVEPGRDEVHFFAPAALRFDSPDDAIAPMGIVWGAKAEPPVFFIFPAALL